MTRYRCYVTFEPREDFDQDVFERQLTMAISDTLRQHRETVNHGAYISIDREDTP